MNGIPVACGRRHASGQEWAGPTAEPSAGVVRGARSDSPYGTSLAVRLTGITWHSSLSTVTPVFTHGL